MFCSIRQYDSCTDNDELIRRVEAELLPAIRDMDGYISYVLIDSDEGDVTSISMFDTELQAEAANKQVADLVEEHLSELLPEEPMITIGEVVIENRR